MLSDWSSLDTWIVVTAALAAVGCALPGCYLLLRRQSLLGDALSHSVLPGIVLAVLAVDAAGHAGWVSTETLLTWRMPVMFLGAAATALLSATLSEWLAQAGRLESSAALGVVYTAMFALGLLLIRLAADSAHIDPSCVLYGNLETIVTDTLGRTGIPRAVLVNGAVVLLNLVGLSIAFKELQLTSFDPNFATSLGIPAGIVRQALLAATGATVVTAFESVGSILVIAMLVIPAACGVLLSQRLAGVLGIAGVVAVLSAVLGHVGALVVPTLLRRWLDWPELGDVGTAGMMTLAAGVLFGLAWCFAPQQGWLRQWRDHRHLRRRILTEDILGALYRWEELTAGTPRPGPTRHELVAALAVSRGRLEHALAALRRAGHVDSAGDPLRLSPSGRSLGQNLVRSHRLWESYLARHLGLASRQLHASAEQVEHYLDPHLRETLAAELEQPGHDPHGATIPPAG
jgi:manganese/zinc/iron transport system permease protein